MALVTNSNRIYLTIGNGKVVRSYGVTQDTPGAQKRTKSDGTDVYELRYDAIEGTIKGINIKEDTFNGKTIKKLAIILDDSGENYQVEVNLSSRYAKSFLYALPNVDLSKPVSITPWMKVVNDKKKSSVYIKQDGNDIQWHFGQKDNPNGLPELKKVVFKGEENWDDHDQLVFLENYINTEVKPKLSSLPASSDSAANGSDEAPIGGSEEDDSLPF